MSENHIIAAMVLFLFGLVLLTVTLGRCIEAVRDVIRDELRTTNDELRKLNEQLGERRRR
jgi:hypothetical protein